MIARVRVLNGMAELVIDGEPAGRMLCGADTPAYLAPRKVEMYSPQGIDLYFAALAQPYMFGWDGADGYDYSEHEAQFDRMLRKNPDAKFIVFVGSRTGAPYHWFCRHPEECVMLHSGKRLTAASLASERWLQDCTDALRRFVRHFESGPYADHVAGYNPILGDAHWIGFGEARPHARGARVLGDYSEPMRSAFRAWLRERYGDAVEELRRNWLDPDISFQAADVPTPQERRAAEGGGVFEFRESRGSKVADYYQFYNELNARLALACCRAIKETLEEPRLVGLMHGFSYCWPVLSPCPQGSGHAGVMRLLGSEWVDFLHSPYHYHNRGLEGAHYSMHAVDSVRLHGKAFFDRVDTRTHLRVPQKRDARTPWESEQILKRDAAYALTKGCHCCWTDNGSFTFTRQGHPREWEPLDFDDPDLLALIGRLHELLNAARREPWRSVSPVAVFTSAESPLLRSRETTFQNLFVDCLRQWSLPGLGTPFDDYLLEDFENVERDYPGYIFPDATYVPSRLRRVIRRRMESAGATAVWFYAPGFVDERGCDPANCEDLTGIRLEREDVEAFLQVTIADTYHPLTAPPRGPVREPWDSMENSFGSAVDPETLAAGFRYVEWPAFHNDPLEWPSPDREQYRFTPRFHVSDGDATPLGMYRGTERVGLAVKEVGGSTSLYIGAPLPPPWMLRNAVVSGGGHVYSPRGSLVYAGGAYLSVTALEEGTEVVALPRASDVEDALTGRQVACGKESFSYETRRGETRIFRLASSGE